MRNSNSSKRWPRKNWSTFEAKIRIAPPPKRASPSTPKFYSKAKSTSDEKKRPAKRRSFLFPNAFIASFRCNERNHGLKCHHDHLSRSLRLRKNGNCEKPGSAPRHEESRHLHNPPDARRRKRRRRLFFPHPRRIRQERSQWFLRRKHPL